MPTKIVTDKNFTISKIFWNFFRAFIFTLVVQKYRPSNMRLNIWPTENTYAGCKIPVESWAHKFIQTLPHDYTYTGRKGDSSDEEPEEKICFSVEEGNMNKKSTKKIGDISSSEDEDFPMFTKKRKRLTEISDDD